MSGCSGPFLMPGANPDRTKENHMPNLAEIKARIERDGPSPSDVGDLLKYIDSGRQVSEFTAFLLSNMGKTEKGEMNDALNRWVRLNAEDFIQHLKR